MKRLDVPYHPTEATNQLDRNHNFFVLVDDGTVGKFGGEIEFRAALESELASSKGESTPMVTIVIQGGPNTIRFVVVFD